MEGFSLLPHFLHPVSLPLLPLPFPNSPPPPSLNLTRGLGERCELPRGVWGGAPAEIEFGAF